MLMKQRGWILAAGLVMIAIVSLPAQAGRLAFGSDRSGGDRDVWKSKDETPFTQEAVTDESAEAHNPTIAPSGRKVIYDVNGVLWMNDFDDPIGTAVQFEETGSDPDAGPYINTDRDFRIISKGARTASPRSTWERSTSAKRIWSTSWR